MTQSRQPSLTDIGSVLATSESQGRSNVRHMILTMLVSDGFFLFLAFALGYGFYALVAGNDSKSIVLPLLPAMLLFIPVYYLVGLYPPMCLSPAGELKRISTGNLIILFILGTGLFLTGGGIGLFACIVLGYLASIVAVLVGRHFMRGMFAHSPWWGVPVLICGAGKTGRDVADRLRGLPRLGLKPTVFVDECEGLEESYSGIPILQGYKNMGKLAREGRYSYAILAKPEASETDLARLIDEEMRFFPKFIYVPSVFDISSLGVSVRDLNGILALETHQRLLSRGSRFIKRFVDIIGITVGGIIAMPIILALALIVKLDSKGPAFYGHTRIGLRGKPFKAWKFRSMRVDGPKILEEHFKQYPERRLEWESTFKLKDDPRITKFGRFLRKTSLDEVPQIWNILKGEMTLVGPRPIITAEIEKYGAKYELFSSVKPGLSGLWQVSGRSDTDYEKRVELDIYYVRNWSIWLDIYIILKTVAVVLEGGGAY